ncbi:MAG: flavodoxin family protein [Deltaproteobacteria bacterium]|nr:flavodoxin family protein [Deltaproteobacteria bacterium]
MKLLGLSAGRKMGNGEILLKESLLAAEEAGGVEVEVVRLWDLEINPCTGCEGCTLSLATGGTGECVRWKDDALWLRGKFEQCDALIVSAPVFELRPSGSYCTMNDRFLGFGPRFLMGCYHRPPKVGAMLAAGGSDWVQLALPQLTLAFHMLNIRVVDQYVATWVGRPGHVLLREDHLARARRLGEAVADAAKKPAGGAEYVGPSGACPHCHTDLLTHLPNRTVECPICGIKGQVSIVDGEFAYLWDQADPKHFRWGPEGAEAHFKDILAKRLEYDAARDVVKQRAERYRAYAPYVRPESKAVGGKEESV